MLSYQLWVVSCFSSESHLPCMNLIQGLYSQGKSGGKCSFHLGQGKSRKLAMVREKWHFCNVGEGKNTIFYCHRSI